MRVPVSVLFLLVLLLHACRGDSDELANGNIFQGYVNLKGGGKFKPCNYPDRSWQLIDKTGRLERLYTHLSINGTEGRWLYLQCKGKVDSLERSRTQLKVSKIMELSARHYNNSCINYEYWLFNYHPVWEIEISKTLGLATFFIRSRNRVREFQYREPVTTGRLTDYAFIDKKDTLWVEILPNRCRDGRTEVEYARSAVVWWKDSVLTGCAVVPSEFQE